VVKAEGEDWIVKWDEPDENEPESKVSTDDIIVLPEPTVGCKVKCDCGDEGWWKATVKKNNGDGTYVVVYDDDEEATLGADKVRTVVSAPTYWFKPYRVGDEAPAIGEKVEAFYKADEAEEQGWYTGTIKSDAGGGSFEVEWDDDEDSTVSTVPRAQIRRKAPRTSVWDVAPGTKFKGVVNSVVQFGCFVNIGVHADGQWIDGLVHARVMARDHVEDPSTIVSQGQEVDVWFEYVRNNPEKGIQAAMSMVEGQMSGHLDFKKRGVQGRQPKKDISSFAGLGRDTWLKGTVTSIQPYGLFVEVKPPDGTTAQSGLVPTMKIREGVVEDTQAEAKIGQEVDVHVDVVDVNNGKLAFSMIGS